MEFGSIQTEVQGWTLDMPSTTLAKIPGFVNEAVKDACKRYNFRFMEAEQLQSTVYQQRTLPTVKPSNWKEKRGDPYYYRQDGSTKPINWAPSEDEMIRTYAIQLPDEGNTAPADKGSPRYVLERPDDFDVFPLPDAESDWNNGNYRLVLPYWKYPDTMVQNTDHNWITDNGEYYVIYKAAASAIRFNRDEERAAGFDALAEQQFKRLERQDKLAKLPDRITLGAYRDVYSGRSRSGANRG